METMCICRIEDMMIIEVCIMYNWANFHQSGRQTVVKNQNQNIRENQNQNIQENQNQNIQENREQNIQENRDRDIQENIKNNN